MTALFVIAGAGTLLVLFAVDRDAAGLRGRAPLLVGVATVSVAALAASWLPAGPLPAWVGAVAPVALAVAFLLATASFRHQ